MNRHRRLRAALVAGALLGMAGHAPGASAPDWLRGAAQGIAPSPAASEHAEVLLSENVMTVASDGTWQQVLRYAVLVGHSRDVRESVLGVPFVEGVDRIQRADAWLLRQGKLVEAYPRKEWLDRADVNDATLYSDFRSLLIASPLATPGDVFGGEVLLRHAGNASQLIRFSLPLFTRRQRLELHLPKGWSARLAWLNGKGPEALVSPNTQTWEVRDLPADQTELWASEQPLLLAALGVLPPPGAHTAEGFPPTTWHDLAAKLQEIQRPQCDAGPALTEKAGQLTAGLTDPGAKVQALAKFAQGRRYINVNRSDGFGFGYRPRKATEILAADYGDCKDKSNLLQALLREAGVRAHLVAAFAGDPDAVRPEWPSPAQFNHAIVAVEVPAGSDFPGTVDVSDFGRVLFFDPTAPTIPIGHLPWLLQGSRGLICDARTTGLVQFPRGSFEDEFKISMRASLTLDPAGAWSGQIVETRFGQLAAVERNAENAGSHREQVNYWSSRLSTTLRDLTIEDIASVTAPDGWSVTTTVRFKAGGFGQSMRGGMLIIDPTLLMPVTTPSFPDKARQRDLLIGPVFAEQEVAVNLPAGSHSEIPAANEVQSDFGRYRGKFEAFADRVVCHRSVAVKPDRIPPGRYQDFRRFLTDMAKAERTVIIVHLPQ